MIDKIYSALDYMHIRCIFCYDNKYSMIVSIIRLKIPNQCE